MSTNAEKIAVLNSDKDINLLRIAELELFTINLDSQIAYNLTTNASYEDQKTLNDAEILNLENENAIIDEMIADYS